MYDFSIWKFYFILKINYVVRDLGKSSYHTISQKRSPHTSFGMLQSEKVLLRFDTAVIANTLVLLNRNPHSIIITFL
jgi:hypothetical protein